MQARLQTLNQEITSSQGLVCLPLPSSSLRLTSLLGTLVALDQSIARTKPKSASVLGVQGKAILALVGFTTGYALGFLW